jgi:glycosyltransferase involved in cell wall biosynthesis
MSSPLHLESSPPVYLVVHSDHLLDVAGPNSGAEMATLNQARFLAASGRQVLLAARLKGAVPEQAIPGVELFDLGPGYDVEGALDWADAHGRPYVLVAAGKAFALVCSRRRELCRRRVFISHDRCAGDSGLRPEVLDQLCDVIFCVSHAQREKLLSEGAPGHKMVVVHNGVDFSIFSPTPPEAHQQQRLLFCGALVPDKGLHLLIEAFARLRQTFPHLQLEVFGSASLWSRQEYLDTTALAAALPGLVFHGRRSQREIVQGLQRCGVCVVPSIWFDPYPLTSLEAQACGAPVVAFRMGGLPEGIVAGETGVVVDEVSSDALAAALATLLRDPQRLQRMSANAAEHAARSFRWELVVEKMVEQCEPEAAWRRSLGVYGALGSLGRP